jgi:hypothetical protein
MNIQTVAENLRNTISGKEKYLAECKDALEKGITSTGVHIAVDTTREFLEINIGELKRILQDVEQCAKQASDDSWITNPDRMGGGGWTAEELDPNRGWK